MAGTGSMGIGNHITATMMIARVKKTKIKKKETGKVLMQYNKEKQKNYTICVYFSCITKCSFTQASLRDKAANI